MTSRPFVHIGLAKAASTFLQQEVFPAIEGVRYLGKHHVEKPLARAGAALVRQTSLRWRDEKFAPAFHEALDDARARKLLPVYSEEDLSVFKFMDPETACLRLRRIIGPFDTLLIIRHPMTWLRSHYLFRLSTLERDAVFGFDRWFERHIARPGIGNDVDEIHFADLASVYRGHCDGEMHILPYELLKLDPARFARALAKMTGLDEELLVERVSGGPKGGAHKVGISEAEQEIYETAHWVVLEQFGAVKDGLRDVLAAHGAVLTEESALALDSLIAREERDLRAWREFYWMLMKKIRPLLAASSKARPNLSSEQQDLVRAILHRQLRQLGGAIDRELPGVGIAYGESDAVATGG